MSCMTSVYTTALKPPNQVYRRVMTPTASIETGMLQPVTRATGMAEANTRTASPRARVTRNTTEVQRRVVTPKRCSSLAYAVSCSPVK